MGKKKKPKINLNSIFKSTVITGVIGMFVYLLNIQSGIQEKQLEVEKSSVEASRAATESMERLFTSFEEVSLATTQMKNDQIEFYKNMSSDKVIGRFIKQGELFEKDRENLLSYMKDLTRILDSLDIMYAKYKVVLSDKPKKTLDNKKLFIYHKNLDPLELEEKISITGMSTFHLAVVKDDIATVKLMLKLGQNINELSKGYSAAMLAAKYNRSEILKYLIKERVNLKVKSPQGYTVFDYAKYEGALESIQILELEEENSKG